MNILPWRPCDQRPLFDTNQADTDTLSNSVALRGGLQVDHTDLQAGPPREFQGQGFGPPGGYVLGLRSFLEATRPNSPLGLSSQPQSTLVPCLLREGRHHAPSSHPVGVPRSPVTLTASGYEALRDGAA